MIGLMKFFLGIMYYAEFKAIIHKPMNLRPATCDQSKPVIQPLKLLCHEGILKTMMRPMHKDQS